MPCAVATSSHKIGFKQKTMRHKEVFQLFDHIVTGRYCRLLVGHPDIATVLH